MFNSHLKILLIVISVTFAQCTPQAPRFTLIDRNCFFHYASTFFRSVFSSPLSEAYIVQFSNTATTLPPNNQPNIAEKFSDYLFKLWDIEVNTYRNNHPLLNRALMMVEVFCHSIYTDPRCSHFRLENHNILGRVFLRYFYVSVYMLGGHIETFEAIC